MALPIENILENIGVPKESKNIITLNEPFDWENTAVVIELMDKHLDQLNFDISGKKKVIKIVTEVLDNVCRHAQKFPSHSVSCFSAKSDKEYLYLGTRNLVPNATVGPLLEALELLNMSGVEELNAMYRERLKTGKLSEEGFAGLGLIEIARKSKEKIKYTIEFFDVQKAYFTFLITINIAEYIN
jgi:hypothetical protein